MEQIMIEIKPKIVLTINDYENLVEFISNIIDENDQNEEPTNTFERIIVNNLRIQVWAQGIISELFREAAARADYEILKIEAAKCGIGAELFDTLFKGV